MFFRAAQHLASRRPEVVFLCAGHGELEDELRLLHEQLGLGDHLRMLGLRRDVPRLMSAADIFCLTSDWEGFPNAVLEAMASGLPTVVTRFSSADEIIHDGWNGLKVDLDNDGQLAEAIESLLDDPTRRDELGSQARQYAQAEFSWEKLVSVMSELYEEFLQGRPR
jgi:glycosyltransferase involved in cell wall biosynthesis